MKINGKELKKILNEAIKDCKVDCKHLEHSDHDRIDLEGKVYAYEWVKSLLNKSVCPELFD